VSIFFYPWYGTPEGDQYWRHWEQSERTPPESIGANFYPVRGTYRSADPAVLDAQMYEVAAAGIDTVVVSWWGRGSFEDSVLRSVVTAADNNGLTVAIHVEPYEGRDTDSLETDLEYLRTLGIHEIYLYNAMKLPSSRVRTALHRVTGMKVWAQSGGPDARSGALARWASAAGAQGIYTYDTYGVVPSEFAGICSTARASNLKCSPSVGPGWDGTRATKFSFVRDRRNGATYDAYWAAALDAGAHVISITSYNEWHEGTAIEPARSRTCLADEEFCYQSYEGAYGWHGDAAGWAYLNRTRHWTSKAKDGERELNDRLSLLAGAIRNGDTASLDLIASSRAVAGKKP